MTEQARSGELTSPLLQESSSLGSRVGKRPCCFSSANQEQGLVLHQKGEGIALSEVVGLRCSGFQPCVGEGVNIQATEERQPGENCLVTWSLELWRVRVSGLMDLSSLPAYDFERGNGPHPPGDEIGANYLSTSFQRVLISSLSLGKEQSKTRSVPCSCSADGHGFAAGWRWFCGGVCCFLGLLSRSEAFSAGRGCSARHFLF